MKKILFSLIAISSLLAIQAAEPEWTTDFAAAKAKAKAEAASAEYDARRTAAERDLEGLNQASGATWETLKAQADKDLDALKTALDAFSKALGH